MTWRASCGTARVGQITPLARPIAPLPAQEPSALALLGVLFLAGLGGLAITPPIIRAVSRFL